MQVDNYKIKKNTYLNRKVKMMDVKEKGVTIMSLVITIIVLLILAGITIKFAISDNGIIIRIQADTVRKCSRPSKGVKVMRLVGNGKVVAVACVPRDESDGDLDEESE